MTDLPDNTVSTIQRMVSAAFAKVSAKDSDRKDANEVFQTASQDAIGERENLLTTLAGAAATAQWDGVSIEMAIDAAKAARNNQKDTSINTFSSEIKRAMHPSVRHHVGAMFTLAKSAWDDEGKLGKDDTKPLRKAYARRYHMVVGAMFNAAIAGNRPETATALNELALGVIRERELDYTAVHKRLVAIRAQLEAFARDFPVDGITTCAEFLSEVTVKDLKACVLRANTSEPETAPEASDAAATNDDSADAPMPGVSDLLDDALRDMQAA